MAVRLGAKRFNWLSAGRRWRKSTLVMAIAVEAAATGSRVVWGAPVYDQVRIGWEETRKAAWSVATFNQSRMTCDFGGDRGSILFRSLDDPDSARGHTADLVVMDEVASLTPEAWREVLRPMLLDTGGGAWGVGSPSGRNWFWQECQNARDRADSAVWVAPTLGVRITEKGLERCPHPLENPEISFEEIVQLWQTMPESTFRQEILGEFIEDGGGVFRRVAEAATGKPEGRIEGHAYVMGVDWGRSNDFTVVSVIDATTRRQVALDRFSQIDYALQLARLRALKERYQPVMLLIEANSMGGPLVEALQRSGWPVRGWTATNATKAAVVDGLALALEQGRLVLLDDETQMGELLAFESERLPSGMTRYGAPSGGHDDTVIALCLALEAAGEARTERKAQPYSMSVGNAVAHSEDERKLAAARARVDAWGKVGKSGR